MPWKERAVMSQRENFIAEALQKEQSFSALCRTYGISRKTGYKWLARAQSGVPLEELSRRPTHSPARTPAALEALILEVRDGHPAWGPRKLERWLLDHGYEDLPSKTTIERILKRQGRIDPAEAAKHTAWNRFQRDSPNDLWQMDFKGQFQLLNGGLCFPLTSIDDHSRYALCVEAKDTQQYAPFFLTFSRLLAEFGLPRQVLCDHGKPWSDSRGGITAFDVWMMQLDILPIHGRAYHPQTQGKIERFHRTLKNELLKHRILKDLPDAQVQFDLWRNEYNNERPHEALDMRCPAKYYSPSPRQLPASLREPEYDQGEILRRVSPRGYISFRGERYFLSESLVGRDISLHEGANDTMIVCYGKFDVARLGLREHIVLNRHVAFSTKV